MISFFGSLLRPTQCLLYNVMIHLIPNTNCTLWWMPACWTFNQFAKSDFSDLFEIDFSFAIGALFELSKDCEQLHLADSYNIFEYYDFVLNCQDAINKFMTLFALHPREPIYFALRLVHLFFHLLLNRYLALQVFCKLISTTHVVK